MRAVFLDRDGVLNRLVEDEDGVERPPRAPELLELLPGVAEACRRLKEHGFCLLVATNQPDVARGRLAREAVEAVNAELLHRLPLDEILVCYHDDPDGCECRKPRAGLLLEAAERLQINLSASYVVGDRATDIEAGVRAGCRTVAVGTYIDTAGHSSEDLLTASSWILSHDRAGA